MRLAQHDVKPFGLYRSVVFLGGALRFHLPMQDKMEEFLAPANDVQSSVLVLDSQGQSRGMTVANCLRNERLRVFVAVPLSYSKGGFMGG